MKKLHLLLIIISFLILGVLIVLLVYENYFRPVRDPSDETGAEIISEETTETPSETEEIIPSAAADNSSPVISGVRDLVVHVDETIDFAKGITVSDDTDPSPTLEIDSSGVDINAVGSYIVIYIASDSSGNRTIDAANVRVVSAEKVSMEDAIALADQVIAEIITDDMDDVQKLNALWWHLYSMGYAEIDYAGVDDYLENAYHFLDSGRGNGKCFYAASRLILERLGFTTMMVENIPEAAREHYWNLVSADGGNTWYHFDPTHWNWVEDGVISMVTDEWLWSFSSRHDYMSHDWDTSRYPATPETEFGS